METDVIIFEDVAYSERLSASIKLNAVAPTSPVQALPNTINNNVASWGTDNLRPQKIYNALKKLPQAKAILEWQAKTLYSGGLVYGVNTIDENGDEKFTRKKNKAADNFFKNININRYLIEACLDYYWYGNPFDEILVNSARQIVGLASQDSSFCRVELQNPKTGQVENCYMSANWDRGFVQGLKPFKLLDPYYNRADQLRTGRDERYFYHRNFPSPGTIFYSERAWHALVESGWLEVAEAIPAFKKALFKNQMTIKYHMEIATWYWEWKYENEWQKFTPEQKRQKIKEELELIEATLAGKDNAGKSIKSLKKESPDGKELHAVTITALDDKIKSGVYIEDSQEAFSNILFSMGVDPTLVGNAPGKNMGGGSGSDKRVAYNIYMLSTKADADLILEPLAFISDYMNWGEGEDLVFMFKNYYIATLDQGKEVSNTGNGKGGAN